MGIKNISNRVASLLSVTLLSLLTACGGGQIDESAALRKPLTAPHGLAPYSRDDLYRFFVVAFGAAPGVTYMGQAVAAAEGGAPVRQIVNAFTTKPQFLDTYPDSLSDLAFAQKLVENIVGGSATAAAKDEASKDIVAALRLPDITRGDIVYVIFNNLANKPSTDPTWGKTSLKLANQVAYAKYYTESLRGDTDRLSTLREVVANVTELSGTSVGEIQAHLLASTVVVASLSDTIGPAVSEITLTPTIVDASSADQTITATVSVTDQTGVDLARLASGAYYPFAYNGQDVQGTRRGAGPWTLIAGDAKNGTYRSVLTVPKGSKPGQWTFTSLSFIDVLGFSSTNGAHSTTFTVR